MIEQSAFSAFDFNFLEEEKCRMFFLKKIHPGQVVCPGCAGSVTNQKRLARFWAGQRVRCEFCNKFFTALTGTFLSGSHLSFRQLFLLAVLSGVGIKDRIIADKIKIAPESCCRWRMRFKTASFLECN